MKYTKQKYEIWKQEEGILGIFKQIEKAGRICYKSENNIAEDSAEPFVKRMINSKHYAMLEHGTVYLQLDTSEDLKDDVYNIANLIANEHTQHHYDIGNSKIYFTTNLRVLVEKYPDCWEAILTRHFVDPDAHFPRRVCTHFTTNRQVTHEFVRHRTFSFAQESTRYCNYTNDKFNGELTFIEPTFSKKDKDGHEQMTSALRYTETYYKYLIQRGWKPQEAATVLPNALKTELVMTGFVTDWEHFFDLRALGKTGKPHPQAEELALPLYKEFVKNNWIDERA